MKTLSPLEVKRIADLAMLDFDDAQVEALLHEMNKILQSFEELDKIVGKVASKSPETPFQEGGVPVQATQEDPLPLRVDRVRDSQVPCPDLRSVFPEREGDFLVVPLVVDRDE